jgi:hypothetical protein
MRWSGIGTFVFVATAIVYSVIYGRTQATTTTVIGLDCVGAPSNCAGTGGSTNSLRNNSTSGNNPTVAGFLAPADGGGGDYVDIGAASAACLSIASGPMGSGTVGSAKITSVWGLTRTQFNSLSVGELVCGTAPTIQIPQGAEIAGLDYTHSTIILTLPLTGTASATINFAISGDNNGTLIIPPPPASRFPPPHFAQGCPGNFGSYCKRTKPD